MKKSGSYKNSNFPKSIRIFEKRLIFRSMILNVLVFSYVGHTFFGGISVWLFITVLLPSPALYVCPLQLSGLFFFLLSITHKSEHNTICAPLCLPFLITQAQQHFPFTWPLWLLLNQICPFCFRLYVRLRPTSNLDNNVSGQIIKQDIRQII